MDTDNLFIAIYDKDRDSVEFPLVFIDGHEILSSEKSSGRPYATRQFGHPFGLAEHVISAKEPRLIKNVALWGGGEDRIEPSILSELKSYLGVPIMCSNGDEVFGVIGLQSFSHVNAFDEKQRDLLVTLANHAAVVLENAQLYDLINHKLDRQLSLWRAVSKFQTQVSDLDPEANELEDIYEAISSVMAGLMDTRNMYIALVEPTTGEIQFPLAYEFGELVPEEQKQPGKPYAPRSIHRRKGLTQYVIRTGKSLLIEKDFAAQLQSEAYQGEIDEFATGSKCWLGAPMIVNHQVIGAIVLQNFDQENVFDELHGELLEIVAKQAAIAIDNARKYDLINNKLARQIREWQAVSQFQARISDVKPMGQQLDAIYNAAADAMVGIMDTRNMYIALLDEESGEITFPLVFQNSLRVPEEEKREKRPWAPRQFGERKGLTEYVIGNREPLLVEHDFEQWVEDNKDIEAYAMGTQCWLGTPIVFQDRPLGVIGLQNFEAPNIFDEQHKELLSTIANQIAIAIDNSQKYEKIEQQYDLIDNKLARQIREWQAVSQFQERISDVKPMGQQLDAIYKAAADAMTGIMDTHNMYIALLDEKSGKITFPLAFENSVRVPEEKKQPETPYGPRQLGERKGLTEYVIDNREPLLVEHDFEQWVDDNDDIEAYKIGTKCWLGAPVIYEKRILGVIGLQNFEAPNVFDEQHKELLVTIANQIAVAIDNARLLESWREAQREIAVREHQTTVREMALDLVHQINNIVGTIGPWAQMTQEILQENGVKIPKAYDYLDKISRDAQNMLKSAQSLQHSQPPSEVFDIEELMQELKEETEILFSDEISIAYQSDQHPKFVRGVRSLLSSAFQNILVNAWKAVQLAEVEKKTIQISVKITETDPDVVQIRVSDNGCGVPEGTEELVFEYAQTFWPDESGTGYGLWRAKTIIGNSGGSIALKRRKAGTEILVELPTSSA